MLHYKSGHTVKSRFGEGSSSSYIQKFCFPTSKSGLEVVNNRLEVFWRNFGVNYWKLHIFPKLIGWFKLKLMYYVLLELVGVIFEEK